MITLNDARNITATLRWKLGSVLYKVLIYYEENDHYAGSDQHKRLTSEAKWEDKREVREEVPGYPAHYSKQHTLSEFLN